MSQPVSIFLEFNLPNATTWFYFSFLLAMALFFKFSRLLSIRNWDVVTLFLLVPGLLLLQQARQRAVLAEDAANIAAVVGKSSSASLTNSPSGMAGLSELAGAELKANNDGTTIWIGYLWLLAGSVYLLLRCMLDLILVRRPALSANLNAGGMAWLAGALFIVLAAVGFRPSDRTSIHPPVSETAAVLSGEETVGQPAAALRLAQSTIDTSFVLSRSFAVLCHLSVVIGLILVGWRHFQDTSSGVAAATFYLLLPYTGYFVGQVHHVWPMALMIWALFAYRKPTISGLFLGLASGTVFFPALLAPLWISFYRKRGAGRFTVVFLSSMGLCLAATGLVLWMSNDLARILAETFALSDWQPWNFKAPTYEGFWTNVHWAYRTPIFILYLALVVVTAFWPNPKNLAHVIALSAAILIGIQLWYADQGGVYVLWYLPLVLLLVFRPNLSDRVPSPIAAERDWVVRLSAKSQMFFGRLFKSPEKLVNAK